MLCKEFYNTGANGERGNPNLLPYPGENYLDLDNNCQFFANPHIIIASGENHLAMRTSGFFLVDEFRWGFAKLLFETLGKIGSRFKPNAVGGSGYPFS